MSSSFDAKTIYEIFRACRLCGAGGGYKMPIIPSVVGFDCADIELRQKIRECVQIEVNQDDKMPPLICELCVDKVNDFYEFREMCRETNVKTRQRLGLPEPHPRNSLKENSDADNCILGVTEPVYVREGSDEPRRARGKKEEIRETANKEEKRRDKKEVRGLKRELENLVKKENVSLETRSSRDAGNRASRHRAPTPVREKRQSADNISLSRLKDQQKKTDTPKPKPILKKVKDEVIDLIDDDDSDEFLSPPGKRTRDRESKDPPPKKIKLTIKVMGASEPPVAAAKTRAGPKCSKQPEVPAKPRGPPKQLAPSPRDESPVTKPGPRSSKGSSQKREESPVPKTRAGPKSSKVRRAVSPVDTPGPRSSKVSSQPAAGPKCSKKPSPPPARPSARPCEVCGSVLAGPQGLASHLRGAHHARFTLPQCACDACEEWFVSAEEAAAHHKKHKSKPYKCRGCAHRYRTYPEYTQHVNEASCFPWTETPDVKCEQCWRQYPTATLLRQHRCLGPDARPGGKCSKCKKSYATMKGLRNHESACTSKKKVAASSSLDPLEGVRVPRGVRARLQTARVRLVRCDHLTAPDRGGRYSARALPDGCDLGPNCVYPYRVRVKREPLAADGMVSIQHDLRDQLYIEEDYVHWDSDSPTSDEEYSLVDPTQRQRKVPTLTTLTLKTIFSKRCLGKVPRKFRKVRSEKFDFYNPEGDMDTVQSGIGDIINTLGDDANESLGFSITDVKSIRDTADNNSLSLINNDSAKRESDVTDNTQSMDTAVEKSIENGDKGDDALNGLETVLINKRVLNVANVDNGSETDASLDDDSQTSNVKVTSSESIQNGKDTKSKMGSEHEPDLINEISELYDKKIMEQLDDKVTNLPDSTSEKILLQDLVPDKGSPSLALDPITDEEFNFDP